MDSDINHYMAPLLSKVLPLLLYNSQNCRPNPADVHITLHENIYNNVADAHLAQRMSYCHHSVYF